jgi:glycosyltransferase involved in cell wall biosynthesis
MRRGQMNPLAIARLRKIIRTVRPDVVHSHILHSNILARITRLVTRIPVLVCTAHNIHEGGAVYNFAYRCTDSLADLTTNVSRAAVDRYIAIKAAPAGRIRFVPNGLDLGLYHPEPKIRSRVRDELNLGSRFVWLAIGRLHEQKDYGNMLRAFAAATKTEPNPGLLLIAGVGPLDGELKELAATLGIGDRVQFLGVRSDIPELMNASDGYLLSSAWEGMPLVLQEAGASELPVVATNVGGNSEVVNDGVSGFLVPPQNEDALTGAMKKMMALPDSQREEMGRAGRTHIANRYDMERVLDQWEAIYGELLAERTA